MAQLPRVVLGSGRWGGRRAVTSIAKHPDNRWRARYRDAAGREHARHFDRKVDAQRFLDNVTAIVVMVFSRSAPGPLRPGRKRSRRNERRRATLRTAKPPAESAS